MTHGAANRLNLRIKDITLVLHGVDGVKVLVETKLYLLKIHLSMPKGTLKSHDLVCYGLDSMADVHAHVTAKQLKKFFPDIPFDGLVRPGGNKPAHKSSRELTCTSESQSHWRFYIVGWAIRKDS